MVMETVQTTMNRFGLTRIYAGRPTVVPDTAFDLAQNFVPTSSNTAALKARSVADIIRPYPNISSWLYDQQYWLSGDQKSLQSRDAVQALFGRDDFKQADVAGVNFRKIQADIISGIASPWSEPDAGWKKADVTIRIPLEPRRTQATQRDANNAQRRMARYEADEDTPRVGADLNLEGVPFTVTGLFYRSIRNIIAETFSRHPVARHFHMHPFVQQYYGRGTLLQSLRPV